MRNWNTFGLLCLTLLFLTACNPGQVDQLSTQPLLETQEPSEQPDTESVQSSLTSGTYTTQGFPSLADDDILLQLAYEPTFSTPSSRYPYGRVPEFTLLADGRLFYMAEEELDRSLKIIILSPEDTNEMLQEMLDLGIAILEDYTEDCMLQSDGNSLCIEDAPFTILRQRLPDESLKEVRSYANFSNEPKILEVIIQRLSNYTHPGAEMYQPSEAALFLQSILGEVSGNAQQYPLVGNFAPPTLNDSGIWAFYLSSEELTTYLQAIIDKRTPSIFEINNNLYQAELVPWLPGADYREQLEADFPPQNAVSVEGGKWFSACPSTPERSPQPIDLRLIYLEKDDLYMLEYTGENSQEPVQLTNSGNITSFKLSPNGSIAYFAENDPAGASLWAVDLLTNDSYLLSDTFPAGQKLALQEPSPDGAWLALTVMLDDHNGELWAVQLNGAGVRKLVDLEGLRHENFPDCAIVPNQVIWIPGSHRLIYDGIPICDSLFIYMPELKFIDLDSGEQGSYPSGELVFSNNGDRVVIKDLAGLLLAQADGSQVQLLDTPFFPIGMGEWWLYPQVFWEVADQTLLVVTSGSIVADWDNFDTTSMSVFRLPTDGRAAQKCAVFEGSPWSVAISPDGQFIAYYTAPPQSNDRTLHIVRIEDGSTIEYIQGELLDFINWSPDGRYFTYRIRSEEVEIHNWLGDVCGQPTAFTIDPIQTVHWLDSSSMILESSTYAEEMGISRGVTHLYLAGINQEQKFLVEFQWSGSPEWQAVLSD